MGGGKGRGRPPPGHKGGRPKTHSLPPTWLKSPSPHTYPHLLQSQVVLDLLPLVVVAQVSHAQQLTTQAGKV